MLRFVKTIWEKSILPFTGRLNPLAGFEKPHRRVRTVSSAIHIPNPLTLAVPLAVLLLLLFLVSAISLQVSEEWNALGKDVNRSFSRVLLLNTIYWDIHQARILQKTNPAVADSLLDDAHQKAAILATTHGIEELPKELQVLLTDPLAHTSAHQLKNLQLSQQKYFVTEPEAIQQKLKQYYDYSQHVTLVVSIGLISLGLTLVLITAWDYWRLLKALTQSRDLQSMVQEEERHRIAQDLHDGVIQQLVDLKRQYEPEKVNQLVDQIRRICHNLMPQVLEDTGLVGGLEFLVEELRRSGIEKVSLNYDPQDLHSIPKAYHLPIFRMIQELFNNIKRHARASHVNINVVFDPEHRHQLRVYIKDNGQGFDLSRTEKLGGFGLRGIEARVTALGGNFTIISSGEGRGSLFQLQIPIQKPRRLLNFRKP